MKIQRGLSLLSLLLALGLTFSGCGGSNDDTIITGPFPFTPSAPVANPDAYTTAGSSALVVPAINGVLINDATNEVPGQPVTVTFQSSSVGGGTVSTTNNNDGSFAYTPAPGYLGLDSFEYEPLALRELLGRNMTDVLALAVWIFGASALLILTTRQMEARRAS